MKTALVVDDSKTMRMILCRILQDLGFAVAEAADGREAMEKLPHVGPDLVLVDWNMPRMNGYEFLTEVRALRILDSMPVIMVTTECESSQVVKALEAGANEYIMKPFTKEVIIDKLQMLGVCDVEELA